MSLSVHRAERSDALVAGLAQTAEDGSSGPFRSGRRRCPVEGRGAVGIAVLCPACWAPVAAGPMGVCANVVFPSPAQLVRDAVHSAAGFTADEDPWAPRRIPWVLLELIDTCAPEPWCRTLARHLGLDDGSVDRGRRMAVAQKLAGLYTSYGDSGRP